MQRPQPTQGGASSFLSSLVKLFVEFRQVFRLFCQVFPNISLAILGNINGLRGRNLLFDAIPNILARARRIFALRLRLLRILVAVKARTPERLGRGRPENSIACHTGFWNIFAEIFFVKTPRPPATLQPPRGEKGGQAVAPAPPIDKAGRAGAPNLRFPRLAPCTPRYPRRHVRGMSTAGIWRRHYGRSSIRSRSAVARFLHHCNCATVPARPIGRLVKATSRRSTAFDNL